MVFKKSFNARKEIDALLASGAKVIALDGKLRVASRGSAEMNVRACSDANRALGRLKVKLQATIGSIEYLLEPLEPEVRENVRKRLYSRAD